MALSIAPAHRLVSVGSGFAHGGRVTGVPNLAGRQAEAGRAMTRLAGQTAVEMGPGLRLGSTSLVREGDWDAVMNQLNVFRAYADDAGIAALDQMSYRYSLDVARRYRTGHADGPAAGTLWKRMQGKGAGKRPAIPPSSSRAALRSPRLAGAVRWRRTPTAGGARFDVSMIPSAERIARVHEFGQQFSFVVGPEALGYLWAMMRGEAGKPATGKAPFRLALVNFTVPARPIWQPVMREVIRRQPQEFAALFAGELRRLGLRGFNFGVGAAGAARAIGV